MQRELFSHIYACIEHPDVLSISFFLSYSFLSLFCLSTLPCRQSSSSSSCDDDDEKGERELERREYNRTEKYPMSEPCSSYSRAVCFVFLLFSRHVIPSSLFSHRQNQSLLILVSLSLSAPFPSRLLPSCCRTRSFRPVLFSLHYNNNNSNHTFDILSLRKRTWKQQTEMGREVLITVITGASITR